MYNGKFLDGNMASERIVKNEILSAIRHRGVQNIDEVHAVVLETDATFSVITKKEDNSSFTLSNVEGLPDGLKEELEDRERDSETPVTYN
ncbi:MAG: YetF domain-containing protein [Psychroserpens sp.]|uniref:YetF domain-containing protein n=1 Tax=Psychroserpens sp. TaxID=2020870 RepID=UPI003CA9B4AE